MAQNNTITFYDLQHASGATTSPFVWACLAVTVGFGAIGANRAQCTGAFAVITHAQLGEIHHNHPVIRSADLLHIRQRSAIRLLGYRIIPCERRGRQHGDGDHPGLGVGRPLDHQERPGCSGFLRNFFSDSTTERSERQHDLHRRLLACGFRAAARYLAHRE